MKKKGGFLDEMEGEGMLKERPGGERGRDEEPDFLLTKKKARSKKKGSGRGV